LGKDEGDWLVPVREFATEAMMALIREDLAVLGVEMDVFYSEKSLYGTGRIEAAIEDLRAKGLIYEGTLEPPKGKTPEDWEPRVQTLFKSTEFGDDVDRPVMKSDGSWTYFAPDIAYHYDKVSRGFDELIDIFGADHGGYVKRMKAAVAALSEESRAARHQADAAGEAQARRRGTEDVQARGHLRDAARRGGDGGPDVTRFVMLTRKNDAPLDFDVDKVREQSKDNPVFYVQYAHARISSVLRKAEEAGMDISVPADLSAIADPAEFALVAKLAEWPRLVEIAAQGHEPHRVAFYLYDLASEFHALWNKGNAEARLRFIQEEDADTTRAKLALIRTVAIVISNGLGILGVTPVEKM
jgi:arginyl-tRNA synthetase